MIRRLVPLAALVAALLAPAVAHAGYDQESMLQDDNLLLYSPPATVASTLDTLKALGVDRVRLTIKWSAVAPQPDSTTKPAFDASDPSAYPPGSWDRYDTVVRLAQSRGIGVDFNLTAPAPDWATQPSPKAEDRDLYEPSASEFGAFVHAIGVRYSGTYAPPAGTTTTDPTVIQGLLGQQPTTTPNAPNPVLPRVTYWSVWNEPNQPGWLLPQSTQTSGHWVDEAAVLYRGLYDAAYSSLSATGHAQDTILIGETAPEGLTKPGAANAIFPLKFLRDLYCVSAKLKPLSGSSATRLGCPATNARAAFPAAHGDLLSPTGLAHHPYSLVLPPDKKALERDSVGIADLGKLERSIDGIFRAYGRHTKLPIYLTEYGYQTRPPDPTIPFGTRQQAEFLNEADYIAFQDPHVRVLSQFQLQDDLPNPNVAKGSRFYWSTFQSGLEFHGGKPKTSFVTYRLPVWIPRTHGSVLHVWGLLRPAANGSRQTARVQYRRRSGGAWKTVRTVRVSSPRGSFLTRIHPPRGRGSVRVQWNGLVSRSVAVRR